MNLHEECLLKYLLNPSDLFFATETLKANNLLIENFLKKSGAKRDFVAKKLNINYTYS